MADGRHFAKKSINRHISATARPIVQHADAELPFLPYRPLKIEFLKIQDGHFHILSPCAKFGVSNLSIWLQIVILGNLNIWFVGVSV